MSAIWRPGSRPRSSCGSSIPTASGGEAQTKVQAEPGPLDLSEPDLPGRRSPLGRHRRNGLQQQGQAGPPIRAVLQRDAAVQHRAMGREQHSVLRSASACRRDAASQQHVRQGRLRSLAANDRSTSTTRSPSIPKTDPDVGDFFSRLPDADYLPTWYQQRINGAPGSRRAERGRRRPPNMPIRPTSPISTVSGRTFLTIADNGKDAERQRAAIRDAHRARHRGQPARGDRRARPHRHALRL